MTVIEFPQPAPAPDATVRVIRRLSRPLVWLITTVLVLTVVVLTVMMLAVLFYDGPRLLVRPGGLQILLMATPPPIPEGWFSIGRLPLIQRLALVVSGGLMMGPALAILWTLRRLFVLYGEGRVLEADNARLLRLIAIWLIAYAVGPTLGHVLVASTGFDDRGWLRMDSAQALVLGLVLFVIARVMQLAAEAHDDASRFV
ncbi:MAG: DUF2975 domain-containing protein [Caulobacteraceae bacterium]|nr:MAG: DUF2975 domain-containing protein [Caulobacteraceae bacterium]